MLYISAVMLASNYDIALHQRTIGKWYFSVHCFFFCDQLFSCKDSMSLSVSQPFLKLKVMPATTVFIKSIHRR